MAVNDFSTGRYYSRWLVLASDDKIGDHIQGMTNALQFPFHFDPDRLKTDFRKVLADDWVRHFNSAVYEGDWSVVPLRSIGGEARQIFPDPTATDSAPTEI